MLDKEADRVDISAGHCSRRLHTQAGKVKLKVPKLRRQTFERRSSNAIDVVTSPLIRGSGPTSNLTNYRGKHWHILFVLKSVESVSSPSIFHLNS